MKILFTKTTEVMSSAVIAVCSGIGYFSSYAEDKEEKSVKVIFDFGTEDFEYDEEDVDISQFETYTTNLNYVQIPAGRFTRNGYGFDGWTYDGVYGYYGTDIITIPSDVDEFVIKAVWYDLYSENKCNIIYNLEYKGEQCERPTWLKNTTAAAGMIFEPNYRSLDIGTAYTNGYTDGVHNFTSGQKIILPDHDLVLTPIWHSRIQLTFTTGDVDRVNGNKSVTFEKISNSSTELPTADRFSRSGFNLVGWLSDYDGQIYKVGATVTTPDTDATYTAVWEPKSYNVVFSTGEGGKSLKVTGLTDTAIICPDPEHTVSGKYFAGWKDSTGKIYPVGSEYIIPGALPGSGISLKGVWETGEPPVTEPPVSATTTTATTSATPSESTTTTPATTESTTGEKINFGDVNTDGEITVADATLLLQHLGNADKYKLSEQGQKNADCYNTGDGLSARDALAIQKYDSKVITSLPESE